MLENEKFRQENQMQLLTYGHEEGNKNKVWAVMGVPSLEHMAGMMIKPAMIKMREKTGASIKTQK